MVGGGEGQAAKGRLNPLLGMFGLAMSPKSTSHSSNMFKWPKRHLAITG